MLVTTALVAVLASSLFSGWLTSSLSPFKPPIAQAAGKAIFEIKNSTKPTFFRKSETELAVTARIKVSEAGSTAASNETFAYITVGQTYSKIGSVTGFGNKIFDTWRISSVSMSSLNIEASYGQTNSKIISPTLVEFYNRSNELVARLDYSRLPTDAITSEKSPCFLIGATGTHRVTSARDNGECNGTGVSGDSRTPITAVASYTADPTDALVDNYQLVPGASEDASVSKIQSWIRALMADGKGALRILVPADQNTPNPPYIAPTPDANGGGNFIPADPSVGRPQLQFRLVGVSFNGARGTLDQKWLIFQAYGRTGTSGPFEKIDNFYYLVESCDQITGIQSSGHCLNIIYDTDQANVFIGIFSNQSIENGGALIQGSGGLSIPDDDINKVFGYIMNVPKASRSDNCDDPGGVYKTGRPGTGIEGATTKEIYDKHPDTVTTNANKTASNLHSNCGTKVGEGGWLDYWGVKINFARSEDGGGDCSLVQIAKNGLDNILTSVVACAVGGLINSVIGPFRNQAQKLTGTKKPIEERIKDPGDGLVIAWKYSLSLLNILVILALLAIAFANVLHLNLNVYAAKKALPGIVIGVIGANASMLIIRFILDVVQALTNLSLQVTSASVDTRVDTQGDLIKAFIDVIGGGATSINYVSLVTTPFILFIVIIAVLYFILLSGMLAYALIKRIVWLYALIVVAPLAFASYGIPSMSQWFGKWWDQFLRQAFVLPILFLAIAFFITYGNKLLGLPVDFGSIATGGNEQDLIKVLLTFAAATAILKVPGAISKGMYDMEAMSKKAFGTAKNAPSSAWGVGQGLAANKVLGLKQKQERIKKLEDRARAKGTPFDIARADRLKAARERVEKSEKRYKNVQNLSGAMRGRAYTMANPEKTVSKWWEARTAGAEKASSLEASKINIGAGPVKGNISDIVSGRVGGYSSKRDIARKIFMEEVSSPEEALEAAAASKDTIKAVERVLHTLSHGEAMKLRRALASSKKEEDMRKVQQQLIDAGVNPRDLLGKGLFAEGQLSAFYEYIVRESRRKNVSTDDKYPDETIQKWIKPLGSYYSSGDSTDNPPSGDPMIHYDPIRSQHAIDQARNIVPGVAGEVKDSMRQLTDQWRDLMAQSISTTAGSPEAQRVQGQLGELRNQSFEMLGRSLDRDGQRLVDNMKKQGDQLSNEVVRQAVENVSAAHDLNIHSGNIGDGTKQQQLHSTLESAHNYSVGAQGVSHEATQSVAGMSDGDWDRLGKSQAELVNHLSDNLVGPIVSKLSTLSGKTDPAAMQALTRSITDTLAQAVAGRGKNSVKSVLQREVSSLGNTISKELGMHQISTGSIAAAMSQARASVPTATPTPSSTTIPSREINIKVEQNSSTDAAAQSADSPVEPPHQTPEEPGK
ncbi:MAG: hypothetical protein AAB669_00575 [Patescibacteria group bacterium]